MAKKGVSAGPAIGLPVQHYYKCLLQNDLGENTHFMYTSKCAIKNTRPPCQYWRVDMETNKCMMPFLLLCFYELLGCCLPRLTASKPRRGFIATTDTGLRFSQSVCIFQMSLHLEQCVRNSVWRETDVAHIHDSLVSAWKESEWKNDHAVTYNDFNVVLQFTFLSSSFRNKS